MVCGVKPRRLDAWIAAYEACGQGGDRQRAVPMVARAWLDAHEPHVTDRGGRGVRQSLDRLLGETRSTAGAWPAVSPKLRAAVLVKMMVDGGTWPWCLVEEGAMWRSQVGDDARRAALGPNGGAATDRAPATIRSRRRGTAFGDQLLHRQRGSWVHHYAGCTICEQCRSGWPQMCSRTAVRVIGGGHHGGHALFLRVPAATLVPLDDALSFEAGAAIGCGTGTASGGLQRLGEIGSATLVVFGQGPVGLSATMLAAARGARVIAVNPAPTPLRRSLSFGAAETVDPATTDPVAAIRELTGGRGAQLVLETSGLPMTSGMRRSSSGALRFDLAPYGISTMAVEPGFFRTELLVEGSSTIWPELEIDDYAERTAQTCGCQQL